MNPVVGTWVRNQGGISFYWTFNDNNTYETDEIPGHAIARGRYDYDPRGQVYVYLDGGINAFRVDDSGNNLTRDF